MAEPLPACAASTLGWRCTALRPAALIAADPLTVILYGDAKPMPSNDKRSLMAGLRQEARRYAGFHWDARRGDALGALADAELIDEFRKALASPDRDDAAQSYVVCLRCPGVGAILPELGSLLKAIACDDSRWGDVRTTALDVWLRLSPPTAEAIDLLDNFADGRVTDGDDELAGRLFATPVSGCYRARCAGALPARPEERLADRKLLVVLAS